MIGRDGKSRELIVRPRRQLTLPRDLCDQLGVEIGDKLDVTVEGGALVARPARDAALDALKEIRQLFERSGFAEEELQQAGRETRKKLSSTRHARKV